MVKNSAVLIVVVSFLLFSIFVSDVFARSYNCSPTGCYWKSPWTMSWADVGGTCREGTWTYYYGSIVENSSASGCLFMLRYFPDWSGHAATYKTEYLYCMGCPLTDTVTGVLTHTTGYNYSGVGGEWLDIISVVYTHSSSPQIYSNFYSFYPGTNPCPAGQYPLGPNWACISVLESNPPEYTIAQGIPDFTIDFLQSNVIVFQYDGFSPMSDYKSSAFLYSGGTFPLTPWVYPQDLFYEQMDFSTCVPYRWSSTKCDYLPSFGGSDMFWSFDTSIQYQQSLPDSFIWDSIVLKFQPPVGSGAIYDSVVTDYDFLGYCIDNVTGIKDWYSISVGRNVQGDVIIYPVFEYVTCTHYFLWFETFAYEGTTRVDHIYEYRFWGPTPTIGCAGLSTINYQMFIDAIDTLSVVFPISLFVWIKDLAFTMLTYTMTQQDLQLQLTNTFFITIPFTLIIVMRDLLYLYLCVIAIQATLSRVI